MEDAAHDASPTRSTSGEIDVTKPSARQAWDLHRLHFVHGPPERVVLGLDVKFSILFYWYTYQIILRNRSCRRGGRERIHERVYSYKYKGLQIQDTS